MNAAKQARLVALAEADARSVELPEGHRLDVYEYGGNGDYEPGLVLDLSIPGIEGRAHIVPYEMLGRHDIKGEVHLLIFELELGNQDQAW